MYNIIHMQDAQMYYYVNVYTGIKKHVGDTMLAGHIKATIHMVGKIIIALTLMIFQNTTLL